MPQTTPDLAERCPLRSRQQLAHTIEQFLASEISAFEFDQALDAWHESDDSIARFVAANMWLHYDDLQDHRVVLSKPQWDQIQRHLLLLRSDCELKTVTSWAWSWTQLLAAFCLGLFGIGLWLMGWGAITLVCLPLGLVSMFISRLRGKRNQTSVPWYGDISPFESLRDLQVAYETAGFVKTRFPREVGERRIRSGSSERLMHLQFLLGWLVYAPLPLLFQTFPQRISCTVAQPRPSPRPE